MYRKFGNFENHEGKNHHYHGTLFPDTLDSMLHISTTICKIYNACCAFVLSTHLPGKTTELDESNYLPSLNLHLGS